MSKDLLKRGFKFVGSTICYAFMQAVGMVNDHSVDCFCYDHWISAGCFSEYFVERTGRFSNPPPPFGQIFFRITSTHCLQKVHSNEQIMASLLSIWKQCRRVLWFGRFWKWSHRFLYLVYFYVLFLKINLYFNVYTLYNNEAL